jgi:RNA ligase (TIGR02306 family)
VIASKGLSEQNFSFIDCPENDGNLYVQMVKEYDLFNKIFESYGEQLSEGLPVFFLGEIYGEGVQDLHYGCKRKKELRIFDIKVGDYFTTPVGRKYILEHLNIPSVPSLYNGPYSRELIDVLCDGITSINDQSNLLEGVVIRPQIERRDDMSGLGRVMLKHISEKYLTRKNGTEYN